MGFALRIVVLAKAKTRVRCFGETPEEIRLEIPFEHPFWTTADVAPVAYPADYEEGSVITNVDARMTITATGSEVLADSVGEDFAIALARQIPVRGPRDVLFVLDPDACKERLRPALICGDDLCL